MSPSFRSWWTARVRLEPTCRAFPCSPGLGRWKSVCGPSLASVPPTTRSPSERASEKWPGNTTASRAFPSRPAAAATQGSCLTASGTCEGSATCSAAALGPQALSVPGRRWVAGLLRHAAALSSGPAAAETATPRRAKSRRTACWQPEATMTAAVPSISRLMGRRAPS